MLTWEIEWKVHTALHGVVPLPGCPLGRLFMPERLRSNTIRWGHCSKVACHPGVSRTISLIKQWFWWQSMVCDTRQFVLACSVRARSHIALDFVTGLPASQGNMLVLTVVDRFSKATHCIPLPKSPSARETAVVVIHHVFRIHGLPTDVVSDTPVYIKILETVLSIVGGEC